jgi:hypothetical protein
MIHSDLSRHSQHHHRKRSHGSFPSATEVKEKETTLRSIPEKPKDELSFPSVVKVHQMVMKFKNKIQLSGQQLSITELTDARTNFDFLKFADYEDAVHYKVLGRDMNRLRVFPTLDSAISFCEHLIPGSRLISFDDLIKASRCDDLATRDVTVAYLRRLATDGNCSIDPSLKSHLLTLPHINSPKDSKKTNRLFTQKVFGNQARLSLNSHQKQTIVRQDSDHINLSIRARPKVTLRKTELSLTACSDDSPKSQKEEASISSRIRFGLQRSDSGFSYREAEGGVAKSSGIKIITHHTPTWPE